MTYRTAHKKSQKTLQDILHGQDLLHVGAQTLVQDAARQMAARNVSAVVIMEEGALRGIFTERDALRRLVAPGLDPTCTPIAQVMTTEMICIDAHHQGFEAFQLMHDCNVRHVIVLGRAGPCPYGIVSIRDFPPGELATFEREIDFEEHVWEVV